jgi:hypothetical protein
VYELSPAKKSVVVVFDENADLAGGMTRNGHERDVAGFGQTPERPNLLLLELELEQVGPNVAGQCEHNYGTRQSHKAGTDLRGVDPCLRCIAAELGLTRWRFTATWTHPA